MPLPKILSHLALSLLAFLIACTSDRPKDGEKPRKVGSPTPVVTVPNFSGEEAFQYLLAQTKLGPRNPGSAGHARCLNYLLSELRLYAESVNGQEFSHRGYRGEHLRLTNIIASFNLQAEERMLLAAHWDTRPYADQEKDSTKRNRPILGANDGASGVAVLLQLAKIMKQYPPPVGVDIVLFDGEDFGRATDFDNFLLGSKHFASQKQPSYNPRFGIVVDMIGDAQLEIMKEESSLESAPDLVQYVWATAEQLGLREFVSDVGSDVYDDHIPLNEVGIKSITLIDFQYPDRSHRYWHTSEDTPDKCHPSSLETVGTLLTHLVYKKPL